MRSVRIGFSTPKDRLLIFPWLIRKRDNTKYSHSYWRFKSESWGTDFIYQNSGMHTNFMGSKRFEQINEVIEEIEIKVSDEIESKIGKLCVNREGKGYAVGQVLWKGVLWVISIITFGKIELKNPIPDNDYATDCIEESAKILSLGLGIDVKIDMDSATVKQWYDFVKQLEAKNALRAN